MDFPFMLQHELDHNHQRTYECIIGTLSREQNLELTGKLLNLFYHQIPAVLALIVEQLRRVGQSDDVIEEKLVNGIHSLFLTPPPTPDPIITHVLKARAPKKPPSIARTLNLDQICPPSLPNKPKSDSPQPPMTPPPRHSTPIPTPSPSPSSNSKLQGGVKLHEKCTYCGAPREKKKRRCVQCNASLYKGDFSVFKRNCPQCQAEVHCRRARCDCGYIFHNPKLLKSQSSGSKGFPPKPSKVALPSSPPIDSDTENTSSPDRSDKSGQAWTKYEVEKLVECCAPYVRQNKRINWARVMEASRNELFGRDRKSMANKWSSLKIGANPFKPNTEDYECFKKYNLDKMKENASPEMSEFAGDESPISSSTRCIENDSPSKWQETKLVRRSPRIRRFDNMVIHSSRAILSSEESLSTPKKLKRGTDPQDESHNFEEITTADPSLAQSVIKATVASVVDTNFACTPVSGGYVMNKRQNVKWTEEETEAFLHAAYPQTSNDEPPDIAKIFENTELINARHTLTQARNKWHNMIRLGKSVYPSGSQERKTFKRFPGQLQIPKTNGHNSSTSLGLVSLSETLSVVENSQSPSSTNSTATKTTNALQMQPPYRVKIRGQTEKFRRRYQPTTRSQTPLNQKLDISLPNADFKPLLRNYSAKRRHPSSDTETDGRLDERQPKRKQKRVWTTQLLDDLRSTWYDWRLRHTKMNWKEFYNANHAIFKNAGLDWKDVRNKWGRITLNSKNPFAIDTKEHQYFEKIRHIQASRKGGSSTPKPYLESPRSNHSSPNSNSNRSSPKPPQPREHLTSHISRNLRIKSVDSDSSMTIQTRASTYLSGPPPSIYSSTSRSHLPPRSPRSPTPLLSALQQRSKHIKIFSDTSANRHMPSRRQSNFQFPCHYLTCNKRYQSVSGLDDHVKKEHTRDANCVCKLCGSVFRSHETFRQHIKSVHFDDVSQFQTISPPSSDASTENNPSNPVNSTPSSESLSASMAIPSQSSQPSAFYFIDQRQVQPLTTLLKLRAPPSPGGSPHPPVSAFSRPSTRLPDGDTIVRIPRPDQFDLVESKRPDGTHKDDKPKRTTKRIHNGVL